LDTEELGILLPRRKLISFLIGLFISAQLFSGCALVTARITSPLISPMMVSFFSECDSELAREAIPSQLKLMEGLLKVDPSNTELLKALCAGYAGYALLFVEDDSPARASELYFRARNYGIDSLGDFGRLLTAAPRGDKTIKEAVAKVGPESLEHLFWTTVAWSGWISLRGDSPEAISQIWMVRMCLERIMEIDPDYFFGTPYALLGSLLAATPPVLGGDPSKSRDNFEKAIRSSKGLFFLSHVYFARHFAVRVQDRELFISLLDQVDRTDPGELPEACLVNVMMKKKAKRLKLKTDELFF
jgi:hypothetical protein